MKTHSSDSFHPRRMIDMLGYRERQGERTESWVVTGGFLDITHGQGGAFNVCSSCGSRVGVNVSVIGMSRCQLGSWTQILPRTLTGLR